MYLDEYDIPLLSKDKHFNKKLRKYSDKFFLTKSVTAFSGHLRKRKTS